MPQSRYFVVRNENDEWMIKFEDEQYGPYQSQSEACCLPSRQRRSSGSVAQR